MPPLEIGIMPWKIDPLIGHPSQSCDEPEIEIVEDERSFRGTRCSDATYSVAINNYCGALRRRMYEMPNQGTAETGPGPVL